MGRLLDLVYEFKDELKQSSSEPELDEVGAPDIDTAQRSVTETRQLRDEWSKACLALAEQLDWQPVEFKQAHKVCAGEYAWRLFCTVANLTQLRDQTYPALVERRKMDRPCFTT